MGTPKKVIQKTNNMPLEEIEIDIDIRDTRWDVVADLAALVRTALSAAVAEHCTRSFTEISLLFTDNAQVKNLNQTYRGKDKPTNVLSFPTDTVPAIPVLGDIAMAFETVELEAKQSGIDIRDHIVHLLIHGYLHLQGLDHEMDADAASMEAIEIKTLADLGISNPYDRMPYEKSMP